MNHAPLLQLSGIRKAFGAVRALRGVSFDLRAGEVHALLGENGAGKSTLIKVITGAHRQDAGTIAMDGVETGPLTPRLAHRLGIAAIYQQPSLFQSSPWGKISLSPWSRLAPGGASIGGSGRRTPESCSPAWGPKSIPPQR